MNSKYVTDEITELLREKLTPQRFEHSVCVAAAARRLAKKYGADEEKAYAAGMLHDIMKNETNAVQLKIMRDADIILNCAEELNPKLWHAMSGAVFIRRELGIEDEDLLSAVRFHTTGRAGMTLLEKVLYVADFISADRDYEGVDEMRLAAEKGLEQAMLEGLAFSIGELSENLYALHPDSVAAYNEILYQRKYPDKICAE